MKHSHILIFNKQEMNFKAQKQKLVDRQKVLYILSFQQVLLFYSFLTYQVEHNHVNLFYFKCQEIDHT